MKSTMGIKLYCFNIFFLTVSYNLSQSQTRHIVENDLELTFLPPPPKQQGCTTTPGSYDPGDPPQDFMHPKGVLYPMSSVSKLWKRFSSTSNCNLQHLAYTAQGLLILQTHYIHSTSIRLLYIPACSLLLFHSRGLQDKMILVIHSFFFQYTGEGNMPGNVGRQGVFYFTKGTGACSMLILVPSTHIRWLTTTFNSSFRASDTLLWSPLAVAGRILDVLRRL